MKLYLQLMKRGIRLSTKKDKRDKKEYAHQNQYFAHSHGPWLMGLKHFILLFLLQKKKKFLLIKKF